MGVCVDIKGEREREREGGGGEKVWFLYSDVGGKVLRVRINKDDPFGVNKTQTPFFFDANI